LCDDVPRELFWPRLIDKASLECRHLMMLLPYKNHGRIVKTSTAQRTSNTSAKCFQLQLSSWPAISGNVGILRYVTITHVIERPIPLTLRKTLESFVKESGLPPDVGSASNDSVTIETILQEKKAFDTSLNFEKLGLDDRDRGWTVQAPSKPTVLASLPSRSNILSVAVFSLLLCSATEPRQYIAVTTADRKLHLLDPTSPTFELASSYSSFQDSPILDVVALGLQYLLVASMSGKVVLYDTVGDKVLEERRDHSKYVVKLAHHSVENITWIASAGWDAKVFLYRVDCASDIVQLGQPTAEYEYIQKLCMRYILTPNLPI
jgi:WD40 repeat protein